MPRRRTHLAKLRPLDRLESRCNPSTLVDPLQLSSVDGVLDITLTAHISSQVIEVAGADRSRPGVPTLVDGFMTFAWTVHQGVASNGQASGDGYPSPTLHVNPGDTLRIHLENQLVGWSGQPEDTNIHTHGLDFSPLGNSDNVLLAIPNGRTNDYTYQVPTDQAGAFWYHPHLHGDVAEQVYRGLAGLLIVGNASSEVEQVRDLPTRLMDVQVQRIETSPTTGRPTLVPLQTGNFDHTQWTINGQYMPDIAMTNPYEVWVTMALDPRDLTRTFIPPSNDISTWNFESPDNQHIYYVAQDGAAFPQTVLKTRAAIAPGKRIAEVVASPAPGTDRYFAITAISPIFADPMPRMTQPLARIIPAAVAGNPDAWKDVTLTNPVATFRDLSQLPVDQYRTVFFRTDDSDPNNHRFLINGQTFPDAPVFQPRAGSVEEWTIVNEDDIPHPLHIHLQHFQAEIRTGKYRLPDGSEVDYDAKPPHLYDQDVFYVEPKSATVVRIQWRPNLIGEAVFHCHNLFHEDGGMMALLNVIPNDPQIAVAPTTAGPLARFYHLDATETPVGTPVASVSPFGPRYRGGMKVALGDVNGDGIPDAMFTGRGRAGAGRVVVRDGADGYQTTLMDFPVPLNPGKGKARGNGNATPLNIAAGDVNGDTIADIIVSSAGGSRAFVRAYSGRTGTLLADFAPFEASFRGGVNIAAADVDGSGRTRIITTPGRGHAPEVKVWGWDLYHAIGTPAPTTPLLGFPTLVDQFLAGGASDRRGLDVTTTSYNAAAGGFFRIVTAPATNARDVTVWNPLSGMDHDASMGMDMGTGTGGTAMAMTTFRPNAKGVARNGFALGSVNTPTGSLLVVGSRDAVRRGAGNPLRFFVAGAGGMATEVGSVNPGLGRAGLSLGGS